jgi:hypothetical protein
MTKALTSAIAVILLASNFTIINAQQLLLQQQQLTSQPGQIENGIGAPATTTTTTTTATIFQSTNDSFSVQVPQGWVIHDLNNTGFALLEETRQGYGMLVQLCPEEQQGAVLSNASGGSSSSSSTNSSTISTVNSCQGAQQELVHIIRYPDLNTRIPAANNVTTTSNNMTTIDNVLSYHLQKLQEVGYRGIQIVNSSDMRVNLTNPQTNQTIATVPAKLVEMIYSTGFAPNERGSGYFILTATDVTTPNIGTVKGYSVFYEGNSSSAAAAAAAATAEITPTSAGIPTAPPLVVQMIFNSFELIVPREVAQALAQQEATAEQTVETTVVETQGGGDEGGNTACDPSYPDVCIPPPPPDLNCGDAGVPVNFQVLPPDPHGFDGNDNDGIGCETPTGGSEGELGDGDGDEGDGDTSCHPSYPDECIPPPPPNLNCDDVDATNFEVVGSDPHGFDGDNDGIGCESGSNGPDEQEEEQQPEGGEGEGNGGEDGNGGAEEGGGENGNGGEDDVDAGNGEGGGASNDDARVQGRGASGPADDYG